MIDSENKNDMPLERIPRTFQRSFLSTPLFRTVYSIGAIWTAGTIRAFPITEPRP